MKDGNVELHVDYTDPTSLSLTETEDVLVMQLSKLDANGRPKQMVRKRSPIPLQFDSLNSKEGIQSLATVFQAFSVVIVVVLGTLKFFKGDHGQTIILFFTEVQLLLHLPILSRIASHKVLFLCRSML